MGGNMRVSTSTLIIGAGYSGLILQHELEKIGAKDSIIIDKGYSHGYTGDDYVIFLKQKFDFTRGTIDVIVSKNSSGSMPFDQEYVKKLYNKKLQVSLFSGDSKKEKTKGHKIDQQKLMQGRNIYGNISVESIDPVKKIVKGYVLHIKEAVEISYETLVSTIPIHNLSKIIGFEIFKKTGLFVSYFPIGIKRLPAENESATMYIQYESDPNIPFYRKQHHGKSIYYEYCLNKPHNDKFDSVIVPGKFTSVEKDSLERTYEYFENMDIFLLGRYSCWDPDFLLDHVVKKVADKIKSPYGEHTRNMYKRIEK